MKKILLFTVVAVLFAMPVFAAGDLTVQGNLVTNGSATVGGQLSVGSAGVKFSDNSVQMTAAGPTRQNKVTTSRAIGTVYQNTTGKPMFVAVTVAHLSVRGTITVASDATSSPTTMIGGMSNDPGMYSYLTFWVLPGNYYRITNDNPITLDTWVESY